MRMAQSGQLRGRVSEDQLIDVLDQVSLRFLRFLRLIHFLPRTRLQIKSIVIILTN